MPDVRMKSWTRPKSSVIPQANDVEWESRVNIAETCLVDVLVIKTATKFLLPLNNFFVILCFIMTLNVKYTCRLECARGGSSKECCKHPP